MSDDIDSKDPFTWTDQDVWYWVYQIGYDDFAHPFWDNHVDGKALLSMKKDKLNQMCPGSDDKTSALMQQIKELKKKKKQKSTFFNKKKPQPLARDYEPEDDDSFSDDDDFSDGSPPQDDNMNHSASSLNLQLTQRLREYEAQVKQDEDSNQMYLDPDEKDVEEPQEEYEEFDIEQDTYQTPPNETVDDNDPPLPPRRAAGFMSSDNSLAPPMTGRPPVLPPRPQIELPSFPLRNAAPPDSRHTESENSGNTEEDEYLPPNVEEQEEYVVPDEIIDRSMRKPEPVQKVMRQPITNRLTMAPPPQKPRQPDPIRPRIPSNPHSFSPNRIINSKPSNSITNKLKPFEPSSIHLASNKPPPPLPGIQRKPKDATSNIGGSLWNNILKPSSHQGQMSKSVKLNTPIKSPTLPSPIDPVIRRLPSPRRDPNNLSNCKWYHENWDRTRALQALKNFGMEGAFTVRKSNTSANCPYSLSLYFNGNVRNLQIGKRLDNKFALGVEKVGEERFSTVKELIDYHKTNAVVLAKNEGRLCLIYPVPD